MTQTLELTAAELELIENKRKQDILAEEAEKLKKEAKIQKESIEIQNSILKEQKEANLQVLAATEYYNSLAKLNPKYKLEVTERELKKEIKDYSGARIIYSGTEAIVIKSFDYTIKNAQIILSDSPFKVDVKKHFVYSGWAHRSSTDKGYKMELYGGGFYNERLLSNPKTLNKKIEDKIQSDKDKAEAKLKKASAVETVFNKLTVQYPDAIITIGTEWLRDTWNKQGGETIDIVGVKLANGIKMKFRVFSDKSISRMEITFPVKDSYQLLEVMNGVTFPEVTN